MDIIAYEAAEIAAFHFRDGYNYAESALMGMQELRHIEKRPDIAQSLE